MNSCSSPCVCLCGPALDNAKTSESSSSQKLTERKSSFERKPCEIEEGEIDFDVQSWQVELKTHFMQMSSTFDSLNEDLTAVIADVPYAVHEATDHPAKPAKKRPKRRRVNRKKTKKVGQKVLYKWN